jgi:hypothetical protein
VAGGGAAVRTGDDGGRIEVEDEDSSSSFNLNPDYILAVRSYHLNSFNLVHPLLLNHSCLIRILFK